MKRGRPSEYKEEYISSVDEYLLQNQDVPAEGGKVEVNLPTIEGFAVFIGVSKRVLYEWEKLYPNFMHALDLIRHEQQKRLLDKGLSGQYNSTIAKLILSSNHNMSEKTQTDLTTDGEKITFGWNKE